MESPILAPVVLKVTVSNVERMLIHHHARQAGMSPLDYIRTQLGLRRRSLGRPTADQIAAMEDEAWSLLREIDVDPTLYFPPLPVQAPSDNEETAAQREARIALLRTVTFGSMPPER
jgi:hypothetical protein